jgi:hypothetical protein
MGLYRADFLSVFNEVLRVEYRINLRERGDFA